MRSDQGAPSANGCISNPRTASSPYDVIVIGYGAAGAVATLEACALGAKVLLIEKMSQPGGISILSAGGIRVCFNKEDALLYLQHTCGGRTPDAILRVLANEMLELPDYLRQLAKINDAEVLITRTPGNYPFPGYKSLGYAMIERVPGFGGRNERARRGYLSARPFTQGCLLFKVLVDNIESGVKSGQIDVWPSSQALSLTRSAAGDITGVIVAHNGDSCPTEVTARRGVILACGGFEANEKMKARHLISGPVLTGSFLGNTGDGIKMAQHVGADIWHMWHYHGPYGIQHSDPCFPFGLYVKPLPMWTPNSPRAPLPKMAWIIVDQFARRYTNEYPPYMSDTGVRQFDHYDSTRALHSRVPSFLLFDEAGRELYPIGRSITNDPSAHYEWSADNTKEVGNGILIKADTLSALADSLNLDRTSFFTTIERWNRSVEAGKDLEFERPPETMMPLTRPPFYAAKVWPMVINTQGGPVHDDKQRILDTAGNPIVGLYAAGEIGSLFGHVYMAGGNLAECFVGGRIAAQHAVLKSKQAIV